ncbi:MAG TPA: SUF system NifU family Fe-S cluster assembly protein, partial [Blastocatellia bacterium]|nr:SUF system NifU family Fe-S cluster assembly protein [Blastocatellia bacterium]
MTDLQDLYQELILDHGSRPRNLKKLAEANHTAEGYNPLCGDKVKVYVNLDGEVVKDISFEGAGCAISTASASIMTETLKGKTRAEADALFEMFHDLVTGQERKLDSPELGKLAVFSGVSEFPMRVKCATLSWHTLRAAIKGKEEVVSTE